ncbi:hypothetical protein HZC53_00385 [Candidatus Uhrbacteria bacterium]|nr:hypothetical protein [Candidatus Uhrbacteria bacterium]
MAGKSKGESGGRKTGQFNAFRYKTRKKGELPTLPVQPNEASPRTASGSGMTSTSLSDLNSSPIKFDRHKFAGKKCQAPKGDGICGAIISARNPHVNVPVCQPCAARLCDQARESGHAPDLEKIWKRLEARREAAQKTKQLSSRPSGVRETSTVPGSDEASGTTPSVAEKAAG